MRPTRVVVLAAVAAAALIAVGLGVAPAHAAASAGRYIVVLEDGVDARSVAAEYEQRGQADVDFVYRSALLGFAGVVSQAGLRRLEDDPRVDYIEPDGVVHATTTQQNATWGLDRVDQRALPLSTTYSYTNTGAGVKAYVIDTGIRITHTQFGGRASYGYDAVDGSLPAADCNGHGTHVAGTIGGTTYGVAKGVSLVAVRVLNCAGSGTWSGVIAGINYVASAHAAGTPAVANMSLGGGASQSVDDAVAGAIGDGVTFAIAAGNSGANACNSSPARVASAITVGATDKTDTKASWSNYGSCVDMFAPGVGITSAWKNSNSATKTISGTSMAAPHVAGVAALYLQSNGTASPATVASALKTGATQGIVQSSSSVPNDDLLFTDY